MSEPRKNHLSIDGGQVKGDDHVASYKPIPEADTDFRTSKTSLHKSKEKLSPDGAEEKLLQKEDEVKIVTRVDMVDAKYAVGDHRNGDAKIELDANKRQFTGLTKEELMKYAEDPFWVRLRWFMFILFWALWLCMLAGAIIIIVRTPKCPPPPPRTWNEKGPLVDMATVKDYVQDDQELKFMGDSKVSGIFASPCEDAYEVLEEPSSCLEKFKEFAKKAKEYGIQVIVDLTANYVAKSHTWFQLSENKSSEYSDYFIWQPITEYDSNVNPGEPNNAKPPNEWVSKSGGSAWALSEKRNEFYLNHIAKDQPDLNFRNVKVVKHFDNVIKIFMQAGAAGIRLRNARYLLVNSSFPKDDQKTGTGSVPGADHTQPEFWQRKGMRDQPELDDLLAHWSNLVASGTVETAFTIAEEERPEYFVGKHNTTYLRPASAAPVPLVDPNAAVKIIKDRVQRWPAVQLIVNDGQDEELAAFSMLLPAAPVLQLEQLKDQNDSNAKSEILSHLVTLRENAIIQHGQYAIEAVLARNSSQSVIACARWKAHHNGYLAVYNPGVEDLAVDLTKVQSLPTTLTIYRVSSSKSNYTTNTEINSDNVLVPAKATVILSYQPKTATEQ